MTFISPVIPLRLDFAIPAPDQDQLTEAIGVLCDLTTDDPAVRDPSIDVLGWQAIHRRDGCLELTVELTDQEGWLGFRRHVIHPGGERTHTATWRPQDRHHEGGILL